MKKIMMLLSCMPCFAQVHVQVQSHKKEKIPLVIGMLENKISPTLPDIIQILEKDFSFTGQFTVSTQVFKGVPPEKDLKRLSERSLFALFLTEQNKHFEWRLYDTITGAMVAGKKYRKRGDEARGWAHNIADMVWLALTGDEGFFSTKIAYCQRTAHDKKEMKHVYIADYDGSNAQLLVDTPTINVAPRWNSDLKKPLLFYSDFTNTNVRLMVSDLHKKRGVASDFDGVNMIPAFSRDGKRSVYCISRGDGNCQLYYYRRGLFKKITHNNGNNVSPSLSDDGKTVYFCSDFETGSPQIYSYYLPKEALERITDGGYCAAPRYNEAAQKLAYSRIVQGVMQIFVYDLQTKTHTQMTHDAGDKEECSWSPCGTKLLYAVSETGKNGRIVMMSLRSDEKHYVTAQGVDCSFPDWSIKYDEYPQLTIA